MAATILQFLSYLKLISDPSQRHIDKAVEDTGAATRRNSEIVAKVIEIQQQLHGCYQRLAAANPQLVEQLQILRGSPLVGSTHVIDQKEEARQLVIIAEALEFLNSDKELAALVDQFEEIKRENDEREEQIARMRAQLAITRGINARYTEVNQTSLQNFTALGEHRQDLQKK